MKTESRIIAKYLAEMPKTESLEDAQSRVDAVWEEMRDLHDGMGADYIVAVERYLSAAQIHRDRIERQS